MAERSYADFAKRVMDLEIFIAGIRAMSELGPNDDYTEEEIVSEIRDMFKYGYPES